VKRKRDYAASGSNAAIVEGFQLVQIFDPLWRLDSEQGSG
jgi:hypothetical protein